MKEKRNGFTLIELLAVIVILAIIALIVIPVIMNIISKANKSAFKDSAYGIIKAGELYYSEKLLNVDGMQEDMSFVFPEVEGLELKGSKPIGGTMIVRKDGKISIAISNGKYCAKKGYGDSDITIDENIEDCYIPVLVEELIINETSIELLQGETKEIEYEIKPLSATNKKLKITSRDENIVSVSDDGKITGIKGGTTTIVIETLDGSDIRKEVTVTVKTILAESISTSTSNVTIDKGSSTTVTATVTPSNASNKNVTWKSNDTSIATVSNGVIIGVSAGSTTITVKSADENASATINVTVNKVANPIITTSNACLKSGTCTNGTKLNIKVNNTENYDFYVIKDTGTELTLIMDRNLGSRVAWTSKEDYEKAGGTNWDAKNGTNDKGPLTAIEALEERTVGWNNIPSYNYTYTDDSEKNYYSGLTRNNIRARLLTYTEATGLGCTNSNNSCPTYLYENTSSSNTEKTQYGYWLSSANSSNSNSGVSVYCYGRVVGVTVNTASYHGVRPVIKISKIL